jgi:PAS domain S-box-containing protein
LDAEARARRAEEQLEAFWNRYQALAQTLAQILWTTPADGLVDDMPMWRAFTGQSVEQVRGWNWLEAVHPEDRARVKRLWKRAVMTATQTNLEYRVRRRDGEYRWFLDRGTPVLEADGRVREWIGFCTDITEHKQAEEERARLLMREQVARMEAEEARTAAAIGERESEAVFEAMTDGVVVLDRVGQIIRMNRAGIKLVGLDTLANPGADFYELPVAERAARIEMRDAQGQALAPEQLPFARIMRGETLTGANAMDILLRTMAGESRYCNFAGAPIRDARGKVTGGVLVYRDVTKRRELERELAERVRQREGIFQTIADALVVYDADGNVVLHNLKARELFGRHALAQTFRAQSAEERESSYDLRDAQGQPLARGVGPLRRVLRGETLTGSQVMELRIGFPDGEERMLSVSGAPIRDEQGKMLGAVCSFRDVTERWRQEEQSRATFTALVEMARALVRGPEAPITGARDTADGGMESGRMASGNETPDTLTRMASVEGQRLVELTREVLKCKQVSLQQIDAKTQEVMPLAQAGLSAEDAHQYWRMAPRSHMLDYLNGEQADALLRGEVVLVDVVKEPPGEREYFGFARTLLAPLWVDERLVGVMAVDWGEEGRRAHTRDEEALVLAVAQLAAVVVERERLMLEGEAARAHALALEEATRRMDEFLGVASHELRTPLTSAKASVQFGLRKLDRWLEMGEGLDGEAAQAALAQVRELLARTERQINKQQRFVKELVDITRIQEGKLEMTMEACDLGAVVRECVEDQRAAHPERVMTLEAPESETWVYGDASRLGQVVTNYLTNALKYSPVTGAVAVRLLVRGGMAMVEVRDEGPGLPKEELKLIWKRFYRAKGVEVQSGSEVGLGLGLHISKSIIKRHGGRVDAESAPGVGSTFWFAVPVLASRGG